MLNRQVLKDSLPTSAALKLLDSEGRIVAAGRAIGLVLKTMKYSHHEPDHWETKRLVSALVELQSGYPRAAINSLDEALGAHSDRFPADNRAGANIPVDTLIEKLDTIFRLPTL